MSIPPPLNQMPSAKPETVEIDIRQLFPKMKPINSAPTLFTFNGFGLGIYGNRDLDAATSTCIKTRCICALFIPVLPLDAYRVAPAGDNGWYFLGKEKLSAFASFVRNGVLGCVMVFVCSLMWENYTNSHDYRVKKANKNVAELVEQGRALEAADFYQGMINDGLADAAPTMLAIEKLLRAEISSEDSARCEAALRYIENYKVSHGERRFGLTDMADLAIAAAAKFKDPSVAERILSAFTPEPDELVRVREARGPVLEELHRLQPDAIDVRINLALIREEFGNQEGALELLEPASDKLGEGEGARLYGHLLLEAGRVAEGLPHLERYVTPRIGVFKSAEVAIDKEYQNAREKALAQLNQDGGPPGFIQRYEAASENGKIEMVEAYVAEWVEKDKAFLTSRKHYQDAATVIPSIMELGVAHLRVAQEETDSVKRTESLKKSEDAFMLMRSSAGDTDEYRFFLGQVYFWSGRETMGRELFNEMLESNQRNPSALANLASVYRELGEDNEARLLLEEAFEKSADIAEKTGIVLTRTLLARTSDEKIEWLSKGKADDPSIMISLAEARAEKAEMAGDAASAARYYREALAGYDKIVRTSSVSNNSAILYGALYRVEGKMEDFESASRLMSDALEMQPGNSILTYNSASMLMSVAVLRIAKDRIDPKLLQYSLDIDSLRFLYQTEAEKRDLVSQLVADPNFRKSVQRYWEAILLAPKNTDYYSWGLTVFGFIDDKESLRRLEQKAIEQDFDFADEIDRHGKYIKGERDSEISESLKGVRQRVDLVTESIEEPKARAMAQFYNAGVRLGVFSTGEATGAEVWIEDLKTALNEVPCSNLRTIYNVSLEMIALEKLVKDDSECAVFINANRRHLEAGDILRILVRAKGDMGDRVRKHPAVVEAREGAVIISKNFPNRVGIHNWLMLDGYKPEFDTKFKQLVKQDESELLGYGIQMEIQYESPSWWMKKFWMSCLDGDEAAARDAQAKLLAAGVKMPEMF